MKLLIDGDVVRYRCGFAAQKTHYYVNQDMEVADGQIMSVTVNEFDNAKDCNAWMEGKVGLTRHASPVVEPVENALHSVKLMMQAMQEKWPDAEVLNYFSCSTSENWRTTEIFPQYKANRPARRPEHDAAIREYMCKKYPTVLSNHLEADDMIAMQAETCRNDLEDYVVCSIDKDLKQIGGSFYDFTKDELTHTTKAEAGMLLQLQTITGDNVDNIPGLKGWGKAKAEKWMEMKAHSAWDAYKSVFEDLDVAWYQYCLNAALVTLPRSPEELDHLVDEVKSAQKEIKSFQEDCEGPSQEPAGPRVGTTDNPEVETSC